MLSKSKKILFIEGTREDKNGSLRLGFQNLLKQKLSGNMPRISMGDDKIQTLRKYKNSKEQGIPYSLIDLDGKDSNATQGNYAVIKSSKRTDLDLKEGDTVYFMIQKMEAWFLSQPEVLKEHFKIDFDKIPYDHPSKIEEPDDILKKLTRMAKYKAYHKVKDGSQLLEKLRLTTLEHDFEDLKVLIEKLNS